MFSIFDYDLMLLLALFSIFRSFFFTQMDVNDPAAQQQGDAHPGQDEAVTKVSWYQSSGLQEDFFMVQRVDERCRKHSQAFKGG